MHKPLKAVDPYGPARRSAARMLIAQAVDATSGAFTASELAEGLASAGNGVGLATIYRALSAMEESGYVVRVGARGEAALFARCGRDGHHHHAVCTGCGAVEHVECHLDQTVGAAATGNGFTITDHEMTIFGVCKTCN